MTTVHSTIPLLACLASLLAVIPIVYFGEKKRNLREASTFIAGFIKFGLVVSMVPAVLSGKVFQFTFLELIPGVALEFRVDGFGLLFALVASGLWIVTSCYSIGYMRGANEGNQTRFYAFFAVSLCATIGVAFAGNLLTLYLFYEMLSLATYPLVTHHQDKEARGGGRTYLTYLLVTSIAFALPAVIFSYINSGGNMDFTSGGFLAGKVDATAALVLLLLFVFGFSKAGVMPFHSWLPNAMVAPTPVSALLHAVAVVKVGVFCIIRAFTGVLGTDFLQTLDVAWVISWMPITMSAFAIGSLSVIGLPITGGLVSKWYLVMGTAESGQTALLIIFLVSSLLNAAYFLPIIYKAFFLAPPEGEPMEMKEAPLACLIPLCFTAFLSIFSFFYPTIWLKLAATITGIEF